MPSADRFGTSRSCSGAQADLLRRYIFRRAGALAMAGRRCPPPRRSAQDPPAGV